MKRKHNLYQGKWTIKRLLKKIIEANGGEMPLKDLLNQMSRQGYLRKPLLETLDLLDVDVIDGKARLRYG